MIRTNNPLEQDVANLFESGNLRVNDMRGFFAESVCEMLDDGTNPMEHYEAALHLFDRWYRNLRKTIWTNGATCALSSTLRHPEEAEKKADSMYRHTFRNIDKKRRKEAHNEN